MCSSDLGRMRRTSVVVVVDVVVVVGGGGGAVGTVVFCFLKFGFCYFSSTLL